MSQRCDGLIAAAHAMGTSLRPPPPLAPPAAQVAFEEALLRERLKFVRELKEQLRQEDSTVTQTVKAYTDVIDGEHRCIPL